MRPAVLAVSLLALAAAACSDGQKTAANAPDDAAAIRSETANPTQLPVTQVADQAPVIASTFPVAQAIDAALGAQTPLVETPAAPAAAYDPALVRAQVLLDRAQFSPGVIDGRDGSNLKLAAAAYQKAKGLAVSGALDAATRSALTAADGAPVMQDYVITAEDAAGPYDPKSQSSDYLELAKLSKLSYATPLEALAERFHMDEALLKALNPGADFGAAGTKIAVARPGADALPQKVAWIEIDKAMGELRALSDTGVVLAVYPATIGSSDRPAPDGEWAVRTLAPAPTYTYDPTRLTFGRPSLQNGKKLTIAAGPNNPVGSTWIDLTKDTFGIHGTPDPRLVGKRASHGCVRLTNWDAHELGSAVRKGTVVVFEGREKAV